MREQEGYYTTNFFLKFPTIRVRYYTTTLRNDNSLHDYDPQGSMTDRTARLCPFHVPVTSCCSSARDSNSKIWYLGLQCTTERKNEAARVYSGTFYDDLWTIWTSMSFLCLRTFFLAKMPDRHVKNTISCEMRLRDETHMACRAAEKPSFN